MCPSTRAAGTKCYEPSRGAQTAGMYCLGAERQSLQSRGEQGGLLLRAVRGDLFDLCLQRLPVIFGTPGLVYASARSLLLNSHGIVPASGSVPISPLFIKTPALLG